jgi:TRAP transporter TAXI family solute receptor
MRRLPRHVSLLSIAGVLLAAGCTRGADQDRLRSDLQARLNSDVKSDLLEVVALRREGSAPLPAVESGASRVIVYFNTTLRLQRDYTFGGWDQLGPSSLAYALGATEKGLFGLQAENRAGDLIRAYGSAIYEESADGWKPVAAEPQQNAAARDVDENVSPSESKKLIDRLAAMVELPPPGVAPQDDVIIAEELARASEIIERRVKRRQHIFTIASGPKDGEYARFGDAMIQALNQAAPHLKLRQRYSEGSVDNAWLLSRGEADYAIVQGDVAAAAVAGEGPFAGGGPLANLQAVGGLFPEAIHVVVLPGSPVRTVADLRGRRVNVGAPSSGTRFDALAVLEASGLQPTDLGEVREEDMTSALERLQRGQIDAVFATASAPTRPLQQLAVRKGLRLLPVTGAALEQLAQSRPGLTPLTLPPNTYPQQMEAVATVASAALLLTTSEAPSSEVKNVADLVFRQMRQQRPGTADVVKVLAEKKLRGVTIPLHPGAAQQQ